MFSRGIALALAAASAFAGGAADLGRNMKNMAEAMGRRAGAQAGKIFGSENIVRYIQRYGYTRNHHAIGRSSIAEGNRHGGPHYHIRERARRLFKPGPERRAWMAAERASWGL